MNVLDRLPADQVVQLRDPYGEILWEGPHEGGEIDAVIQRTGVVASCNLPDGTELARFTAQAQHEGDSFHWRADFTLSPGMMTTCTIILTVVCVIWAKVTYG